MFMRVIRALAKYGKKAVQWAWDHKGQVMDWINVGQGVDWIVQKIRSIVGV